MHPDTCKSGLDEILLQHQSDGSWCPVAYFSRSISEVRFGDLVADGHRKTVSSVRGCTLQGGNRVFGSRCNLVEEGTGSSGCGLCYRSMTKSSSTDLRQRCSMWMLLNMGCFVWKCVIAMSTLCFQQGQSRAVGGPYEKPSVPFNTVHVDDFGPSARSVQGSYVLILGDGSQSSFGKGD